MCSRVTVRQDAECEGGRWRARRAVPRVRALTHRADAACVRACVRACTAGRALTCSRLRPRPQLDGHVIEQCVQAGDGLFKEGAWVKISEEYQNHPELQQLSKFVGKYGRLTRRYHGCAVLRPPRTGRRAVAAAGSCCALLLTTRLAHRVLLQVLVRKVAGSRGSHHAGGLASMQKSPRSVLFQTPEDRGRSNDSQLISPSTSALIARPTCTPALL